MHALKHDNDGLIEQVSQFELRFMLEILISSENAEDIQAAFQFLGVTWSSSDGHLVRHLEFYQDMAALMIQKLASFNLEDTDKLNREQ